MQLMEDVNNKDSVSTIKYNECRRRAKACKEEAEWRVWEEAEQMAWEEAERCQVEEQRRVEAERHRAEEQAKKRVSHFCFVMTELTVSGGGGRCATARKGQGEGVGGAGLQPVCGARARV